MNGSYLWVRFVDIMACVYQVNLWPGFGGSEIYTRFLAEALDRLGHESVLFVNPTARFWGDLKLPGVRLIPVARQEHIVSEIKSENRLPALIFTHSPLNGECVRSLRQILTLAGFLHQPLQYLNQTPYKRYDWIVPVSEHCKKSATSLSYENVYPQVMYGIADSERLLREDGSPIIAGCPYDWDSRKARDMLLRLLYGMSARLLPGAPLTRRSGITLGIVSRLVTIKKFPDLFAVIAPIIRRHKDVSLDVFGRGGWSYVRQLKRALRPIADRVRFWGHQSAIQQVFQSIDYLLTGFPEREGLGLNVLESQANGVPVIAPNAPPFNEVILHGRSGFLYRDPRLDDGRGFAAVLDDICKHHPMGKAFDPRERAAAHLQQFSMDQFCGRLDRLIAFMLNERKEGLR